MLMTLTPLIPNYDADDSHAVPRSLCTCIVLFLSHFRVILYIPDKAMDLLKFMSAFFKVLGTFSSVRGGSRNFNVVGL